MFVVQKVDLFITLLFFNSYTETDDKWYGTTPEERKEGMTMITRQQSARASLNQMLEHRALTKDTACVYEANLADLNAQISSSERYLEGLDRYVPIIIFSTNF